MKKFLFVLSLILGFQSFSSHLFADEGQRKSIRLYLKTGETLDFKATEVDSITSTLEAQKIWKDDNFLSVATEDIDSIIYISPLLKISLKEMNFGKVAVGNGKKATVTITNIGDYTETYFIYTEGVFKADNSGREFSVEAGESLDMEVFFKPEDAVFYTSKLVVASDAIEDGEFNLPLVGKGVTSNGEEENHISSPEEYNIELVVPDDHTPDEFNDFMIVNSYGDFPVSIPSNAKKIKRNGVNNFVHNTSVPISPDGLQLHTLVDKWKNPFLFSISIPGEKPEMSVEQTAITLLMSDPLLITSNEAAYRNTVQIIKELGDPYKNYVEEVRQLYYKGWREGLCPDYSSVNIKPVILALYDKVKDNSNLTVDGLSLKNVDRTPEAISYFIQNDRRRIVHIYPKRAWKTGDSDFAYEKIEDATNTLQDVCQWVIEHADDANEDLNLDDEDKEFVQDLQKWVGEVEEMLIRVGLADANTHIQVPIILESKHANYWKLVREATWERWVNDFDMSTSIYEVKTDQIETLLNDCDQVLVDIYGFGSFNKPLKDYTPTERYRIIFACLHSAYKDYVKPLMDLGSGIIDAVNATGSDNYKYDFRYGERKKTEMALLMKLSKEFASDPDRVAELYGYLDKCDLWSAVKQVTSFVCDEILKCPDENDDKRTYTNLIYNIYKKWTKNPATSKKFRENFKAVANNLTYLKKANFASKVIKVSEASLDVGSSVKAFLISNAHTTFVINKSTDAYITVTEPTEVLNSANGNVHFAWDVYKADYLGNYLYDLEFYVLTPDKAVEFMAATNINETQCDINLSNILSRNGAGNATSVQFRIKAHHPENPDMIYTKTDYVTLMGMRTEAMPEFVDLGLPSGNLWAVSNVGAPTSWDFGDYFAWGETKGYNGGKTSFTWKNYKYCKGTQNSLTKYCTKSTYGNNNFTDGIVKLQGSDDVGSSTYGYYCAIPTKEEWEELMTYCRWARLNNGVFVKSKKNGNIIVLPKAGYRSGLNLYDDNSEGYYWTSTLDPNSPDDAWFLYFGDGKPSDEDYYRCYGRSIRLVLRPKENKTNANGKQAAPKRSVTPMETRVEGIVVKTVSRSSANK